MRDIVVVVQNENEGITPIDTIDTIKKAGYENVFVQWYDDNSWNCSQEEQVSHVKKLGLNIAFAHLGYQNINSIWEEGEAGERFVVRYQKDIKQCKDNGISLVVMHLVGGNKAPIYGEIGLERIRKIVNYAKELDMKVAFENTKIEGYLEYVLGNIKDEHVGLCFDIGHYHAHFHDKLNFEFFKNRILAVHLHDNDGTSDQHLLPFDGTIEWEDTMIKLKEANYDGPITLELCYRKDYLKMSPLEFYQKGYKLGEKIRDIIERK